MKIAFRFFLLSSIIILPLLAQPAMALYFEYDPDDPGEHAPIKEGEKAVIPLDTKDPAYNLWQTTREGLMKGREPGPINIQRFPGGPGWAGIPTFFKLPIALTPEDLKAGDVDVAISRRATPIWVGVAVVPPGDLWLFVHLQVQWAGVRLQWIIC